MKGSKAIEEIFVILLRKSIDKALLTHKFAGEGAEQRAQSSPSLRKCKMGKVTVDKVNEMQHGALQAVRWAVWEMKK